MVTLFLSGRKMGDPHERPFGRSLTGPRKWPGPLLLRDHASKLRTKERKANMLTTETQQFARVLTDKLVEITNQRQGRDRIAIETSPDEVEECLLAAERDIALMDLGRMSSTRRQIQAALKRVRDESFGICTRCEREIGQRRLQVIPWAALCVRCQEALEREDGSDGDQFLPLAA
jgi:DnaK suppressor protein